jgi:hypothetical protein
MDRNRSFKRYTRRLETEVRVDDKTFRGISSDLSEHGLFIRTRRSLKPGIPLDMTIYLPGDKEARLKGIVRRAINSSLVKNGVGVELTERDENYTEFLKTVMGVDPDGPPKSGTPPKEDAPESRIVQCPHCGAKNKVPSSRASQNPICGKCKGPLTA